MVLEQSQQNEIKQEVLKNVWTDTKRFSNTNYKIAHNKTEEDHIISESEADNNLSQFLDWDQSDKKTNKKEEKNLIKEKKQQEKFMEDIQMVWVKATTLMSKWDFQYALDTLYPALEKNKEYSANSFIVDLDPRWTHSETYADSYLLPFTAVNWISEVKSPIRTNYEMWLEKIYNEIKNNEGKNKWKDLWIATLAMYFLMFGNKSLKLFEDGTNKIITTRPIQ